MANKLEEKELEKLQKSENDKLQIQYTFKIEYANPYNTNS